uniref:U1-type domain-containing protein n=1 Tax=Amphora coffeiformis TaxID=265554 RepID=A0A7S3L3E1_9STRA|eukprot:scaffold5934_cov170-Amphora_coffeaeformis.AAC.2
MSTNLNYKQVANVSRRTWDTETYEKRAQARQEALDHGETRTTATGDDDAAAAVAAAADKQEFKPALAGAAGPEGSDRAYLKARSTGVMQDLEAQVGQSTFVDTPGGPVSKSDGVTATGVGWHCKVCDCFLKDSHTYLDHINGRKHQRKLGYSMHVQRSTKDDLKSKLAALKQKKQAKPDDDGEIDFAARVEQKDQALKERQEERRRRRKERKQKAKEEQQQQGGEDGGDNVEEERAAEPNEEDTEAPAEKEKSDEKKEEVVEEEEEEEEEAQVDPALAAMMGFSGFGGAAKM